MMSSEHGEGENVTDTHMKNVTDTQTKNLTDTYKNVTVTDTLTDKQLCRNRLCNYVKH